MNVAKFKYSKLILSRGKMMTKLFYGLQDSIAISQFKYICFLAIVCTQRVRQIRCHSLSSISYQGVRLKNLNPWLDEMYLDHPGLWTESMRRKKLIADGSVQPSLLYLLDAPGIQVGWSRPPPHHTSPPSHVFILSPSGLPCCVLCIFKQGYTYYVSL